MKTMPSPAVLDLARADLLVHPAVRAWSQLHPARIEPYGIEVLKQKNKSAIYRLIGVGPRGSAVIAKRCLTETASVECRIYKEVLPLLTVSSLYCFGLVEDGDPEFRWLFIEDAGREPYCLQLAEHRELFSRWLGLLHANGARLATIRLPERGPSHYLDHLRCARSRVIGSLANPALNADDVSLLEDVAAQCDFVASKWDQVEECCGGIFRRPIPPA